MKKINSVILFLFLAIQGFPQTSPTVQSILNEVNQDSLVHFVKELSGVLPTTINGAQYTILSRNKFEPGNDMATQYLKQKFEQYGLPATIQTFSSTGKNVYAVQTGTLFPNKKIIICAHMDDMPSGNIAPGADDNASGTAAVIEAARIFRNYSFEYTIVYALWDEEEQGLVGSAYYANQAFIANDSIYAVINMDMIAYDSNNDGMCNIHTRPTAGNSTMISNKMLECNSAYGINLPYSIKSPGSTYSDHASFWNKGYGAILLIEDTYDFHAYYHTINDNLTYYNIPYFVKMSKLAFATTASLGIASIVPVELVMFKAEADYNGVNIRWATSTEVNNKGFSIQRSQNNSEWTEAGFISGKGTTTETSYYSFNDEFFGSGLYYYRLVQRDFDGTEKVYAPVEVDLTGILSYKLEQNYPNPFNPVTSISYSVPSAGRIKLAVYNLVGEEVALLVNEIKEPGRYEVTFDASGLGSGVYFYRMESENFIQLKKLVLLK